MTQQACDRILFQGRWYLIKGQYPLEPLFRHDPEASLERHLSSWDHTNLSFEEQIPRPNFSAFNGSICSACWRGYIGEWAIDSGVLQLKNIYDFELSSLLSLVFPDLTSPIKAVWFSGRLNLTGVYTQSQEQSDQRPCIIEVLHGSIKNTF
jgi:hypothetical protein